MNGNNHLLRGEVTDPEGNPLHGASILVVETGQGTTTDEEGRFRLELEPGEWSLLVGYVGHRTKELEIRIPEQSDDMLRISLEEDVISMDEIFVTGSLFERITRYQPTQSFHVADIQRRNTTSAGTLLEGESGVAMRSMGSAPARPVIRGMDGERIQILQNGMSMGDISSTAHDHAVILDPIYVEQVDIVRGPASLIYGSSAMGGLVNIHTGDILSEWKPGSSGYVSSEGQSGMSSLAGSGRLTHGTENMAFTLRGSLRNTGNMKTPIGEIPDTDLTSIHTAAGVARASDRGFSGVSLQYSNQSYGIPDDPFDQDERVFLDMQRIAFQGMSHRTLNHPFWEAGEVRMTYNSYIHDETEREYMDGILQEEDLELAVEQKFLQTELLLEHGSYGIFDNGTAGLDFDYRHMTVGGEEALTPDARGWTAAAYLVEEIALPSDRHIQSGLRLEWNRTVAVPNEDFPDAGDSRNQGIWAASAGVGGPVFSSLKAGLQLSRAHRTPSVEELFADALHLAAGRYEIGDPSLDNEVGYSLDLFMDYQQAGRHIHWAFFVNRISNYISLRHTGETEPERGLPVMEYFGTDALLMGGEMSLNENLTDRLELELKADYIHGSERAGGVREPLPFMPPMRLAAAVDFDAGRWWTRLKVRHVLSQERTATGEKTTDGYTLTELHAGLRMGRSPVHSLVFSMDNLFDVTWRDHLSRIEQRDIPMMGRNIRISYRLIF